MGFSFSPLPAGFVLGKPLTQDAYKESTILELEREGRLIITRKRDGWKLFAVVYRGKVKIYTAGLNEVDARLDHVKKEIAKLKLPSRTVLCGEGLFDLNGTDDIGKTGSMLQANLAASQKLQASCGLMRFMVFGIVFYGGKPWTGTYDETLKQIRELCAGRYVFPVPVLAGESFEEAKVRVREEGWEGLVLYDCSFRNTFRVDGKNPTRPKGCYKWKPILEDDFIVRRWIQHPEDTERLKEIVLSQIDKATGKEFDCYKLGTFGNEMREKLRHMVYPFVVQAEFEMRFPSGKIRNARFVRLRPDKRIEECVALPVNK